VTWLTTSNIVCVWYPSGGFGHFINAVLTLHGTNFVRPANSLTFSAEGNSHSLNLVAPKYVQNCWPSGVEFLEDKNYCVLVDNGIHDENNNFKLLFPNATVIKMCYSDRSWPIIAYTMIEKAMQSNIEEQLSIDDWEVDEPWVRREKYFLFLRDHHFRYMWKPVDHNDIDISVLLDYEQCYQALNAIVEIDSFYPLWVQWKQTNAKYIEPVTLANNIFSSINNNEYCDLTHVTDAWTQSVIYYYIWLLYKFEIPHNDYAEWFTNTKEIVTMLKDHGVNL